jgi:hypothetical protein
MSLMHDGIVCEKIIKSDNKFQEIVNIAVLAREESRNCNFNILDSQAITWVMRGVKPPENKSIKVSNIVHSYEENYLQNIISTVDDVEISNAVKASFYKSKAEQQLIFEFQNIGEETRRSRVRVLTRMVWHHSIESELN